MVEKLRGSKTLSTLTVAVDGPSLTEDVHQELRALASTHAVMELKYAKTKYMSNESAHAAAIQKGKSKRKGKRRKQPLR